MNSDADLLLGCPDYLSIGSMLKATPANEGGKRILYFEASSEGLDQQNEVVASKALAESADFYLKFGNLDIDHYTQIGAKLGIPDYGSYEIGRPVEVAQRKGSTFVKAEVYSGSGPAAEKANMVWSGMTDINPPQRWYPSVGGAVLEKSIEADADAVGGRKVVITKVRWTNVGISKTPVNQHVGVCATIPVGAFAKSWSVHGLDIAKALEAGYGTDSATLTGGAALREQSLFGAPKVKPNYWSWRNQIAGSMRKGECGDNSSSALIDHSIKTFGFGNDEAAEHVERFMRDLHNGLSQRKAS
jgi:hypothetical protein